MEENMKRMYVIPVRNVCNADCSFCYMKEKKNLSGPQFMNVSKLERKVKNLFGQFNEAEITGGGDPTLHPEINRIIKFFMENRVYTKMYTNGFLLREIEKIDEINISRVHFN